jgi:hypothetical protein
MRFHPDLIGLVAQRYHANAAKKSGLRPERCAAARVVEGQYQWEWNRLVMRMYSADELDVMAEAYLKALDLLPVESPTTALTQRLVQEIGAGVASGIRDEDKLAAAAIARSNLLPFL